jgi:cobalamin biosynthesis protein CobT
MIKSKTNPVLSRLEGPFTAIARAMAEKWDIRIIPSGTELSTDGEVIRFPWNADDIATVPFAVLNGYLDHEVGHIREERSHREAGRETPLAIMRRQKNTTMKMLINVFEDIRMEIKYGEDYLGVAQNLHAANLHSVDLFRKRYGDRPDGRGAFWHTLGCAIILEARGCSTDWVPEDMREYVALCAPEIADSRSAVWGVDSERLAERVFNKVRKAAEDIIKQAEEAKKAKKAKAERSEGGEGSGEGADGEGEGDETGATGEDSDSAAPASDDSEDGEPTGKGAPSQAQIDTAAKVREDATTEHLMDEVGKDIKREAERAKRDHGAYIPNPDAQRLDAWVTPAKGSDEAYRALKEHVGAQTGALRTKLARVIRTLIEARPLHDQERGRLDTTALHQLRLGNKRIFSETSPAIELDTAVSIVVDQSGSMGSADDPRCCAYWARLTCIALAEALDALNVPFEVIGFDNDWSKGAMPRSGFINRSPLRFQVFKAFGEKHKQVRARLVRISGHCDNTDGEAVYQCALRLAQRPEARKLMFVLSDGAPACSGVPTESNERHLTDMVTKITKAGIEVCGIGLLHPLVSRYYNDRTGAKNLVVRNMEDMAADIFKAVSGSLTADLRKRSRSGSARRVA